MSRKVRLGDIVHWRFASVKSAEDAAIVTEVINSKVTTTNAAKLAIFPHSGCKLYDHHVLFEGPPDKVNTWHFREDCEL